MIKGQTHLGVALFVGVGIFMAMIESGGWKYFGIIILLIGLFFAGYNDSQVNAKEKVNE